MRSRALSIVLALSLLAGCTESTGTLAVETESYRNATSYRVDVYADEPGKKVVSGVEGDGTAPMEIGDIPSGRWVVLVLAMDTYGDILGYHRSRVVIQADQTASIVAGPFQPGAPDGSGGGLDTTDFSLSAFAPPQLATLVTTFAPDETTGPETPLTVTIGAGGEEPVAGRQGLVTTGPRAFRCLPADLMQQEYATVERVLHRGGPAAPAVYPRFSEIPQFGTTDFFVVTTASTVTAQKLLANEDTVHCHIFAEVVNGNPVLDQASALAVAQAFDVENPFNPGTGIYDRSRALFGNEWDAGGGRDGDPKVVLLFLSSSSIGGELLFGFFRPADELSAQEVPSSNEAEILYLNATHFLGDNFDGLATLAHEFQHMINYNQKVAQDGLFPPQAQPEERTLDEGFSVLSEEFNGFTLEAAGGGNGFMYRAVESYLADPGNQQFFFFGSGLADYGAGYLLVRYLRDRLGEETITSLVTSPDVGAANIQEQTGRPFGEWFHDWALTNLMSGLAGPVPIEYTYGEGLSPYGTYTIRDVGQVTLGGPAPADLVDPVAPATLEVNLPGFVARYLRLANGAGDDLSINVEADRLSTSNLLLEDPEGEFSELQ